MGNFDESSQFTQRRFKDTSVASFLDLQNDYYLTDEMYLDQDWSTDTQVESASSILWTVITNVFSNMIWGCPDNDDEEEEDEEDDIYTATSRLPLLRQW